MRPEYGETWVYESIVGALPGIDVSDRLAVAVQLLGFELAVVVVAWRYGLWSAVLAGTAAVVVAAAGSWLMLEYSRAVRALPTPPAYQRLLFGSSIEVVLGVLTFVAFVTYLFVYDPQTGGESLLSSLLGSEPPPVAVFVLLLVCWDVVYRIGTCWWATVAGLWRALDYGFDAETTARYARVDAMNVRFAAVQLLLVPFVVDRPLLVAALSGHVLAVVAVATLSVVLQRRAVTADPSVRR
ncbi:DUF7530 family protein [Natrononativus amylolyticus]|uniref:DUF7530 family protein n=1 Tax=Natrononativus amylolyticus TaxID=2963434 RepID=UPI0020CC2FD8|nr:hypothetical protein [Natrononativus amylolyticus]